MPRNESSAQRHILRARPCLKIIDNDNGYAPPAPNGARGLWREDTWAEGRELGSTESDEYGAREGSSRRLKEVSLLGRCPRSLKSRLESMEGGKVSGMEDSAAAPRSSAARGVLGGL